MRINTAIDSRAHRRQQRWPSRAAERTNVGAVPTRSEDGPVNCVATSTLGTDAASAAEGVRHRRTARLRTRTSVDTCGSCTIKHVYASTTFATIRWARSGWEVREHLLSELHPDRRDACPRPEAARGRSPLRR